jgi:thiol-disulfide isomerase/thioredoxin
VAANRNFIFGGLAIISSGLLGLFVLPRLGSNSKAVGSVVADFSLPLVELSGEQGDRFSIGVHRGKVVVLDFWATWCGPCLEQSRTLERFAAVPRSNVVVVGVNEGERLETVSAYLRKHPISYQVVLDEEQGVGDRFGVRSLPTLVVIDAAGKLSSISSGVVGYARLERLVTDAARD